MRRAVLWTSALLLQDLVSKNEALRHQLHQLQVHTEQQLRKKDAAAQAEEERKSQLYQKAMDEAKQHIAEHVVRFNQAMSLFEDVPSVHLTMVVCVLMRDWLAHAQHALINKPGCMPAYWHVHKDVFSACLKRKY